MNIELNRLIDIRTPLVHFLNPTSALPNLQCSEDVVVILGSPAQECQGHGVCMVFPPNYRAAEWPCPNGIMQIGVDGDGLLHLLFVKCTFSEQARLKFFSGSYFRVEAAFQFPKYIARRLNIPAETMVLKAGHYPLLHTPEMAMICLGKV